MQTQEKYRNDENSQGKEYLKKQAETAKEKGGEFLEDVKKQTKKYASEASDAVSDYVQKKPLMALGLAIAGGAFLALLLKR